MTDVASRSIIQCCVYLAWLGGGGVHGRGYCRVLLPLFSRVHESSHVVGLWLWLEGWGLAHLLTPRLVVVVCPVLQAAPLGQRSPTLRLPPYWAPEGHGPASKRGRSLVDP